MYKRSRNHFCHGNAIGITFSECVSVAAVIQRTERMCCVILLPVACLVLQYFSTLIHKCHGFWKNVTEQKIELWFSVQFSPKNSYSQKR